MQEIEETDLIGFLEDFISPQEIQMLMNEANRLGVDDLIFEKKKKRKRKAKRARNRFIISSGFREDIKEEKSFIFRILFSSQKS